MNIPTGYRVRGQKTLALFSFVWRKRDCSLTTEYSFAKYFLFVIVMSISSISNRENAAAHKPIQRKERNDYVYGKGNSRSNPGRLQISA